MNIFQAFTHRFYKYLDNIIILLFGKKKPNLQSIDLGKQSAVQPSEEPMSHNVKSASVGVTSDNYSYLDQSPGDLSAMGIGGMRQQHHYASIVSEGMDTSIDSINNTSTDKLIQQHKKDINIGRKPDTFDIMSVEKLILQHKTDINIGHKPAL